MFLGNARLDKFVMAGVAGGFIAGVLQNPFELVYTRMQVEELYPRAYQRGYTSFADGFAKVAQEGALFRGCLMNGAKIAALCSSMTSLHDWLKENVYYFLGPHWLCRIIATAGAVAVGTGVSMPFDNIRVRLHTMRPLPTGEMPYRGYMHMLYCVSKLLVALTLC